ncbi:MAG: SDR family NAD(P)-dependent oxidoreductase, partial [Phycisphaerales bacterium]|nr:SDR family NAD(P)-dependent oxidoreductase [Phycisphaerales bacterium]
PRCGGRLVTGPTPTKVVVTGGAGFIGANLVRRLLDEGHQVVVLDDLSTGDRANLAEVEDRIVFHEGTVLDPATLDAAVAGAVAVVHLAARPSVPRSIDDPVATHVANADGTLAVLEAARRAGAAVGGTAPQVIVASSSSVYGANPVLPKGEDLVARPRSPYAASKLAAESYALAYHHTSSDPDGQHGSRYAWMPPDGNEPPETTTPLASTA